MILIYRPELDNPPVEPQATLRFAFIPKLEDGTETVKISNGVNRKFPGHVWERIKNYEVVKGLLSRGALRIEEDHNVVKRLETENTEKGIADFTKEKAMSYIEDNFNIAELKEWDAKENRIPIKSAIAKRIKVLTTGKG